MKLNKLELHNYRGFETFHASFHDKLTVIVGDNGAGKTSLLDAAAVAIGTFFAGLDGVPSPGIAKGDVMNRCFDMGSVIDLQPQFPVRIIADGVVANQEIQWERELNSAEGRTTTVMARSLIRIAEDCQKRIRTGDKQVILPLLSYYGTGRLWAQKKEKKAVDTIERFNRLSGYVDCLAAASNEKLMLKWFEKMTIQEATSRKISPEFSAVKAAISQCFAGITGYSEIHAEYNLDTAGIDILFTAPDGSHQRSPMKNLSDGYKNTLSMIADIAYRMAVLNPQLLENALVQTPGVILIDEVDLHLHPVWQQRILADLTTIFPAVQFIVTSHAPSVINSVRKENILILSHGNVGYSPAEEVYGSDSNSILTSVMAASERPIRVKQRFLDFYSAIDQHELDKAEIILGEIEALIGTADPELTSARVTLDLEKM